MLNVSNYIRLLIMKKAVFIVVIKVVVITVIAVNIIFILSNISSLIK